MQTSARVLTRPARVPLVGFLVAASLFGLLSLGLAGPAHAGTVQDSVGVGVGALTPPISLAWFPSGISLGADDTLIGRLTVGTSADSARLADYSRGPAISPESLSVSGASLGNLAEFINRKIAGGYTAVTESQLAASDSLSPLRLGLGANGNYYSGTGFSIASGHDVYLRIYGMVFLMSGGELAFGGNLNVEAAAPGAALVIISNVPPGKAGLRFGGIRAGLHVPLMILSGGDVEIRRSCHLPAVMLQGSSLKLAKRQYLAYDHAVLDSLAKLFGPHAIGRLATGDQPSIGNHLTACQPALGRPSVADEPAVLRLFAGPNPASTTCFVSFALPRTGAVSLAIYDAPGRLVRHLASGAWNAGSHDVPWDLRRASGSRVTAGVYFARLQTPYGVRSIRMIVVK